MIAFVFFQTSQLPSDMLHGHYNPYLVALSYVMAVLSSFVALEFAAYFRKEISKIAWGFLIGGAFALGTGIFTMHFVGMLAYITPMTMGYALPLTTLSLIFAITGSGIAFFLIHKPHLRLLRMTCGGIVIGIAIAGMHYIGMSAMIDVNITYLPSYFFLSILVAIIAGIAVLWLMQQCDIGSPARRKSLKLVSSLVLGAGICGMHYLGMAAAVIVPYSVMEHHFALMAISPEKLSFLIAFLAALVLFIGLYAVGRQLSLLLKLLFGYLIILLMLGPLAYTSLENIASTTNIFHSITDVEFPKLVALLELKTVSAGIKKSVALLTKATTEVDWKIEKHILLTELQNLEMLEQEYLSQSDSDSLVFEQISGVKNSTHKIYLELVQIDDVKQLSKLQTELSRIDNALNTFIKQQIFFENQRLQELQENAQTIKSQAYTVTITIVSITAILALFLSLFISFRISRSIIQLRDASQEVAEGKLSKRVNIESEDEIGQLGHSFNTMAMALEASNRKRDEFIGMAAHDLRVPISVMIQAANLLSTGAMGELNPKQNRITQMILSASASILSLLDDLLSANTVKTQIIQISCQHIDLIEYMEKICDFYKLWAEKKEIDLQLEIQTEEKEAFFDGGKIAQVINNLLSNAVKFSKTQSIVRMIVKKIDSKLRVEVHDQAGGIPENEQDQIFTWFAKISIKPTAGEASHGLGLAICKDIIQAHNGTIGFNSTPGVGSIFFFEIEAFV